MPEALTAEQRIMRDSHFLVTLTVDGRDEGEWKQLEGGNVQAEATIAKPAGMRPSIAIPAGSSTTEKITLTKYFTHADAQAAYHRLKAHVGTGAQATVGQQPLDYAKLPFGKALVDTGVIESVSRPQADAESENLSSFQVVIAPNGE